MIDGDMVLGLPFYDPDQYAEITVRDWLQGMLLELLAEQDGFSGKRPFGNSGWYLNPAPALIGRGWVKGSLDEDGFVETIDMLTYDFLLISAVKSL